MNSIQTNITKRKLEKYGTPPETCIYVTVEYIIPFKMKKGPLLKEGNSATFDIDCDTTHYKRFKKHINDFLETEEQYLISSKNNIL
ncbi:MAG: hypothetical protein FWH53_00725 [Leptospirales bacterium]|nr:hypothetical protein [Leptospirales bacterium]